MPHFNKQLAKGCSKLNRTYLEVLVLLPVILHFATKLFVAVPNVQRHGMRVPKLLKAEQNLSRSFGPFSRDSSLCD